MLIGVVSLEMVKSLVQNLVSTAGAHENHAHGLGDVPAWQTVVIVVVAVGVYIGLGIWRKWRSGQSDKE